MAYETKLRFTENGAQYAILHTAENRDEAVTQLAIVDKIIDDADHQILMTAVYIKNERRVTKIMSINSTESAIALIDAAARAWGTQETFHTDLGA